MSSRNAPSRKRRHAPAASSQPALEHSAPNQGNSGRTSTQPTTPEPTTTQLQRFFAELLGTFLLVLFHGSAAAGVLAPVTLRAPTLRADAMPVAALAALFARWGEW